MKKILICFVVIVCFGIKPIKAQELLPNFYVKELAKGKVQISWYHSFPNIVQVTVQRSFDSTKYFRSVFSSLSPSLQQSGFLDKNVPVGYKVFYRILYVFEGGKYIFTKSLSPSNQKDVIDISDNGPKKPSTNGDDNNGKDNNDGKDAKDPKPVEKKYYRVYKTNKDSLIASLEYKDYRKYRDSINRYTKDTLQYTENDDEVIVKPFVPKPVWKASSYVFTNEKGFIRIIIPQASQRKYRIVFFDEKNVEVLHIRHIKEADLVLDKSNFVHVGWYYFDLYEDEKLKEKNKFFISSDRN